MGASGRVLVVEDEVMIRMLAVELLLDLGHECDEAGTAAEALGKLRTADFGLVFLDIGLPDKKGDDLIREIRALGAKMPLLVASGEDQTALKKRLGSFAPIGFLGKPYDLDRLRGALKSLVG